jgi:hypothetical protein
VVVWFVKRRAGKEPVLYQHLPDNESESAPMNRMAFQAAQDSPV